MAEEVVEITLPDGTALELPRGSNVGDVAAAIGPGLARAALGAEIDGVLVGLHEPILEDAGLPRHTA